MTTKALADIRRGDRIASPNGTVTVTSFTHNWAEDFGRKQGKNTVTVVGTLPNGKQVRLTAAMNSTVEVA